MVRSSLVKCERIDAHTSALSSRKDAATKFFMHASYVASVHAAASVQRRNAVLPPFHPEEGPTNVFNNISPIFHRILCTLWKHASLIFVLDTPPGISQSDVSILKLAPLRSNLPLSFLFHFFLNLFFEPSLLNFQVSFFFLSVETRNLIFFLFLFFSFR